MSESQKRDPVTGERNINLAACRLFGGCIAAGASVVLETWALSHWQPGAHPGLNGVFPFYFFAVGLAAGLTIPRRFWVCPLGVLLGFSITAWCACGGEPGPFGMLFLLVATIAFGLISFAGALAGALIATFGRWLIARRHASA